MEGWLPIPAHQCTVPYMCSRKVTCGEAHIHFGHHEIIFLRPPSWMNLTSQNPWSCATL